MEYQYEKFGIMFIALDLPKREQRKIESKCRKFDTKIERYTDKMRDEFYLELEKMGYENRMGVISKV
jgi:hypothetical protein